jgi:Rrf2 family iron-sulfur cluster assembly transcriptional regulator
MIGGERCITHDLWDGLGREIHRYLATVSLADVIAPRVCASLRMADALKSASEGAAA